MHKFSDLNQIIKVSNEKFKELKVNHPTLRAYLVFSSRFGQSNFMSSPDLIKGYPNMFTDKEGVADIIKEFALLDIAREKKATAEISKLELSIKIKAQDLVISDDVFVELRFSQLNYELIGNLQADPITEPYTVKARSSIRIVLLRVNEIVL